MSNKSALQAYYRAKASGTQQGTWGSANKKNTSKKIAKNKAVQKKEKKKEEEKRESISKPRSSGSIATKSDKNKERQKQLRQRAMNIRNESASAMAKSAQRTAQKTKSGAITSAIKPNNQTKAKQYYNDLAKKDKEKNQKVWDRNHGNASEAAKIAKNTNALGTKVKTHKTGSQKYTASGQLEKVANRAGAYGEMKKTYSSGKSLYEAAYDSRRGKEGVTKEQADAISKSFKAMSAKERKQFFKDMYGKSLKEADKKIDERNDTRVVARDATSEDYLRLQNALRTGGGKGETTVAALGKDRAKNFAALTAQDFQKNKASKAAMGAIEGLSYAPTTNQFNSVYTEQEKNAIEEGKKSGAYMAGYMGGQFAQYGMGGVGSLGRSLTSSALKNAPKTTGKKILANVAGDTAVSAPLDAIDAAKQATDKDGNINAKEFAKYMGENAILFGGGGGALLEGASAGLTKLAGKKLINLQAKANAGTITAKETDALNRLYRNMFTTKADKYSSGSAIADQSLTKAADKRLGVDGVSPDDVPKLMTGKDVADMADLRLKAVQRGLTPDESKHLGELTTKYNVQRVQYENNLKAVVEDSRVNIGKASASDVSRLRRAENYYKSIGATQDAREARLLTEKAEKNFADNVDRVTRAASEVSGKLGREFKIDSADEIAEAFTKAGGQVDDVSQIHGYAQFDKDGNIIEYHVNKDSEQAMEFTFGHEFTHGFESLGKQYDDFKESLIKFVGDEWDEELESVKRQYQNVKNADFEKEAVANLVGRHLFAEDGRYLKHLLKEEPTLFEKIYNMIKKLLRGTSEKDRQLDALSKQLDDMLDSLSAETKSRITGAPDTTEMLFGGGKTLRDLIDSWHPNAEQANQLIRQRDMAMRKVKTAVKSGDYEKIKKARIDAYEKYGWFQGYDGEWRFEIDDKDMSFVTGRLTFTKKSKLDKLAKEPKAVAMDELSKMVDGDDKLAQFIEHKELFKWYPELAELKVEIGSPREYRDLEPGEVFNSGEYANDTLVLNPYLFAKDSNYAKSLGKGERSMDVRSTILHEIQHAIQLREDFAKGSSPDMFPTGVSTYEDAAGNFRAELTDRTPKVYDRDIADMVDRIDEKTEAIDRLWDIDGAEADHFESTFAEFIDLYDFSDDLSKAENIDNAMNFITKQAEDPVKPVNADFEARMRDAIGAEYETYKLAESNPYKAYNQTAGEVESRLVEERFNSQNRKHEYPIKEGQNIRYSEAVNTETAKFPNRTTLNESGLSEPFGKPPTGKVEASYGTANLKGAKDGKLLDSNGKVYPEAESAYKQIFDEMEHDDFISPARLSRAQKYVDGVLAERGYTVDVYHGSESFGFTEFDLNKMDDKMSIFASNSLPLAQTYTSAGGVKEIGKVSERLSREDVNACENILDDILDRIKESGGIGKKGDVTYDAVASDLRYIKKRLGKHGNNISVAKALNSAKKGELYDYMISNGLGDAISEDFYRNVGVYHGKAKMENPLEMDAYANNWSDIPSAHLLTGAEKEAHDALQSKMNAYRAEIKESLNHPELRMPYKQFIEEGHSKVYKSVDEFERDSKRLEELSKAQGTSSTREIAQYAKENGYDSVVIHRVFDYGGKRQMTDYMDAYGDVYIMFNPSQFKSADPFTYRDDGSLIPLNERGNAEEPDIRLSTGTNNDGRILMDKEGNVRPDASKAYEQAHEDGDTQMAQQMVDAVLAERGYTIDAYHGSEAFGFTEFDLGMMDDGASIFSSNSPDVAGSYIREGDASVKPISSAQGESNDKAKGIHEKVDDLIYGFDEYTDDNTGEIITGGRKTCQVLAQWLRKGVPSDNREVKQVLIDLYNCIEYSCKLAGMPDYEAGDIASVVRRNIRRDYDSFLTSGGSPRDAAEKFDDYLIGLNDDMHEAIDYYFGQAGGGIYHGKLKMENPFVVDANGADWYRIRVKEKDKFSEAERKEFEELEGTYGWLYPDDARNQLMQINDDVADITDLMNKFDLPEDELQKAFDWDYEQIANGELETQNNPIIRKIKNDIQREYSLEDYSEWEITYATEKLDYTINDLAYNANLFDIDDVNLRNIKNGDGGSLLKVCNDLFRYCELGDKKGKEFTANTRQVSKMAREQGHDGVIFKNLVDYGGWVDDPRPENIYIVFNSNQFKSADPFTYRDDGSLIPLNERGTEAEPDIRLSTGQNKDGRTRTATSEDDYLNSLARDANADEAELNGIARASDNLEQEAPVKGAMSDTERAQIKAQKLGDTELTDAQVDTLADAQVALSKINGVRVPESLRKSTIKSIEEGYGVQASMLKLRKSEKSGKGETFTTVEDAYKSLSDDYPDLFPKDITNVDDQFARMMEVSTLKGGAKRYKYKYVVPKNRKFNQNDYAKKTAEPKKAEAPKTEKPQKAEAPKSKEIPKAEAPKPKKEETPKPKKEKAKKPAKEEPKETPLPKSEKPPKKPKNKAEEHKAEAPTIEETLENAKKGYITDKELGEHGKRLRKDWRSEVTYIDSAFPEAAKAGEFGGKRIRAEEYNEALSKAQANVKKNLGKVYDKVMNRDDYIVETVTSAAEKHALLRELTIRAGTGDKNAVLMQMKAIDKFDAGASLGGNMLQLQSYILKDSPHGRLRFMMRQIRRLNKEYEAQLKGKKLALTEDQAEKILNTKDELESAKLMEEIGKELWKDIPSGRIEAMNQIRHWSMLFNPKTHARNLGGNAVFKGAREISDELEIAMTKLAKKTGKGKKLFAENEPIMGARVSEKEKKQCKDILNKRFELDYTVGEQRADRFAEGNRTAGYLNERTDSKVKNAVAKTMNKLIDVNYELLDREDKLFFRPAYRKEYIRYCKAKGYTEKINGKNVVTAKSLENMTDAQMKEATAWAMQKAKVATFRDDSAISKRLIQWKQATESAGKTPLGKAGFRTLNVGMEAVLPFVKTPVNILRRGMDYSPVGLFRGVINGVTTKDADVFMQSIHDLSTGLTGTGVFVLGWWAASHDWVTVNAGDISGDAYYDRDMGYQDYSVIPTRIIRDKFHVDVVGNDYSASMDWLAPMQFAFFQGAAVYSDKAVNEGWSTEKMLSVLEASVSPMMEMSFMSTAKDTAESFFERAYRDGAGGEASFAEAAGRTLFGTMPQGWIGSFMPQLMNQSAGFSDKYMRDTSSTKKNEIVKSWDSWFKQMQNRIPGFRQSLNPKLNRKGEKVTSVGDNTLTKLFNSFANPSNVKKITFDKYDNELIKIHNKMEDGKDKNTFFMNFTGNPSYDIKGEHLGKGEKDRRMSYNEKYDYMREKRKTQWDDIKKMVDAKSYGDMTWKMRADEVKDYHYISTVKADKKVYKDAYTARKLADNNEDQRELYNKVKTYGGSAKDYVDSYIAIESLQARSHASINDYHMKALAIEAMPKNAQKKDLLSKAYGVWGDKITPAKKFVKQVGSASKALKEYSDAFCSGAGYCDKHEASTSKRNMSVGLANYDVKERTYRAMGHDWQSAQSGAGLKKYGYSYKALDKMEADAMLKYDADHNNSLKKAELKAYVDSLGLDNDDEKACIFEYLGSGGSKNPYGTIYDHLEWGTEPDNEGGGGYGYGHRRGYRRHGRRGHGGHGGGGGSKGKMPSTDTGAFKGSVSNPFSTSNGSSASNLNDAYRKKARKLMREARKK